MNDSRPRTRRSVKARVLLAAAAGASVLSMVHCGPMTSGNLLAPVTCQADGGPPGCITAADAGTDGGLKVDAGTTGGDH